MGKLIRAFLQLLATCHGNTAHGATRGLLCMLTRERDDRTLFSTSEP
jgi:hypothetical protein